MNNWLETLTLAEHHLRKADPVLAQLIEHYGPCQLKPHTDYYRQVVRSIIGQQLSV
jgi:3-methyladenine DNA glycosylase/8-oxoguanine DNA glycosylase